jgi:hypothetical protein
MLDKKKKNNCLPLMDLSFIDDCDNSLSHVNQIKVIKVDEYRNVFDDSDKCIGKLGLNVIVKLNK